MTQDEFTTGVSAVIRHLLTAGAGAVAANGFGTTPVVAGGTAAAVFVATLGWSIIEKSSLLSRICGDLPPPSELEQLASDIAAFRAKGSNPLLVAHLAQTVSAIANAELAAARPDLVPRPSPAPAPSPAASADPPQAAQEPEPTVLRPQEGTMQ